MPSNLELTPTPPGLRAGGYFRSISSQSAQKLNPFNHQALGQIRVPLESFIADLSAAPDAVRFLFEHKAEFDKPRLDVLTQFARITRSLGNQELADSTEHIVQLYSRWQQNSPSADTLADTLGLNDQLPFRFTAISALTTRTDLASLQEVCALCRSALSTEQSPLLRATLQSTLGNALCNLYNLQHSTDLISEAANCFEQAQGHYTAQTDPANWARTRASCAALLSAQFQQTADGMFAQQSDFLFREAMPLLKKHLTPAECAAFLYRFAAFLALRYLRTANNHHAIEADILLVEAQLLLVGYRTESPLTAAVLHARAANLSAFYRLSQRESLATKALDVYQQLFKHYENHSNEVGWASAMKECAALHISIFEQMHLELHLREAEICFQQALDVFSREGNAPVVQSICDSLVSLHETLSLATIRPALAV